MSAPVTDWFRDRTVQAADWSLEDLLERKGDARIAVVIPARNEAATVGQIVRAIATGLAPLVDEVIVMDSFSSDDTAAVAADAGARVHAVADVRPDLGAFVGKGEALWKSLFVTTADLLVFIDADLKEWGTHFVTGLLGPLVTHPSTLLVRGFYDRVFDEGSGLTIEGGRVTELVAKPWLALHRPELSHVVQPLAGEWAIRRSVLEQLPIPVGYGVELATLLDVHRAHGLDAIAQVDLGRRAHKHQGLQDLGAMSTELLVIGERRLAAGEPSMLDRESVTLLQRAPDRAWIERSVNVLERPPAITVVGAERLDGRA